MHETTLKLMLWILPWLILFSGVGYGFFQSENFDHFLMGDMPKTMEQFSRIELSEKTFKFKEVKILGKSIVAEFYFDSPFPFPIKIKDILIEGETKNGVFELRLEEEVLIQPYENSTLTLRGDLPYAEGEVRLRDARIILEIFDIDVEIGG
jgi:hypothetical protein